LWAEVWPALQTAAAPLLEDRRLWRLQLDTYEREVERYGGPEGVVLTERLFQLDSEAALAILALFPEDARADVRWRLALCGTDQLLNDLGLGLGIRQALLRRLRASFAAEFRADGSLRQQLGERFRKERRELEALLASQGDSESSLA